MPYNKGSVAFRNRSVSADRFAMVPRADIPRSMFVSDFTHKTTFDADYLIPIYVDEVLPGDTYQVRATMFARLNTPLYPIMDNIHIDSFFFFVPCRLVWENWQRFMGERDPNPNSSINYVVPKLDSFVGATTGSIYDYFGLPHATFFTTATSGVNALPFRAYNLIYNEWFRDENLINSVPFDNGNGPDDLSDYVLRKRGKRHDYFTSCLPWPQKGDSVQLPLGSMAPVRGIGTLTGDHPLTNQSVLETDSPGSNPVIYPFSQASSVASNYLFRGQGDPGEPAIYADLSSATAATINEIRQAFQIQRLLERDARGGTRYTEIIRSHFGVLSPDARLQRPEYLGGGKSIVNINPVAQTSAQFDYDSGEDPTATSPLGTLGAVGTSVAQHGFSQSFTEHGYIIGLCSVRGDLTYQQGMHKMWTRSTRFDFYWPVFAHLGEQVVRSYEIYADGSVGDLAVFGYQERWAEYRYRPSRITGLFRSGITGTLDAWHVSQFFGTRPTLGQTFIENDTPMERILAAGDQAANQQFLFDSVWSVRTTRPMPAYSVPGMIDRF